MRNHRFVRKDEVQGDPAAIEPMHVVIGFRDPRGRVWPDMTCGQTLEAFAAFCKTDPLPSPFDPIPDGPIVDPLGLSPTTVDDHAL